MSPISIQTKNSIPVIIPAGRIDSTSGPELEKALGSILEQSKFLIIDLSNCKYLSSAGIRILLLSAKKMIARGGNLFLAGVLPEVFQVLEMGGLHQVLQMVLVMCQMVSQQVAVLVISTIEIPHRVYLE